MSLQNMSAEAVTEERAGPRKQAGLDELQYAIECTSGVHSMYQRCGQSMASCHKENCVLWGAKVSRAALTHYCTSQPKLSAEAERYRMGQFETALYPPSLHTKTAQIMSKTCGSLC
jgi:hypothetical protein